jgi:hypothetical protein
MADTRLQVLITAKDQASGVMNSFASSLDNIGNKMSSVGKQMTTMVTLPIVAGMAFAVKAASDLNETMNKVDVAFKDQSSAVKEWSKTTISKIGLAQGSALDMAALFGDMSTSMGLNTKQANKMSIGLVNLAGDMASFKNISIDRTKVALAGIYTGETEALKSLGIVMTETNLESFAQSQGIKKNIQDMTQAEKIQLRYAYVMSVTKNAQGDFNRTSDSTANQLRTTSERTKELAAQFGQNLLPMVNQVLEKANSLLASFQKLNPEQQKMILIVAGITAVIGPALIIIGTFIRAISTMTTTIIAARTAIAAAGGLIPALASLAATLAVPFLVVIAIGSVYMAIRAVQSLIQTYDELYQAQAALSKQESIGKMQDYLIAQHNAGKLNDADFKKKMKQVSAKATGGMVNAGQPYVVGERGKELFVPNQSGKIVPNNKLSQNNSNTTVNISLNVGVYAGTEVEKRRVAKELYESLKQIASAQNKSVAQVLGG